MNNNDLIVKWYLEIWNEWKTDIFSKILVPEIVFRGSLRQEKKDTKNYVNILTKSNLPFLIFRIK